MSTNSNANIQPYLFFDGRCEEALNFYKKALGAEVSRLMRFKDNPEPPSADCPQGDAKNADKVMHATFTVGNATIMASDGRCENKTAFHGFALSLVVPTPAEAERFFNGLSEGGQVQMPLTKTFFSPSFGMVADRFGVMWMLLVAH